MSALVIVLGITAASPAAAAPGTPTTVFVSAREASVPTGLPVKQGDELEVTARGLGQFHASASLETVTCDATGYTDANGTRHARGGACDPSSASSGIGALLARIGNGSWFFVGEHRVFSAHATGSLELAYYDTDHSDNAGGYSVEIATRLPQGSRVEVGLASERVATGVSLFEGQSFEVVTEGAGHYGWEGRADCSGKPVVDPDGNRWIPTGVWAQPCDRKFDTGAVFPDAPVGALIGRIGSGPWFVLGSEFSGVATGTGELVLRVNDGALYDNEGGYVANVVVR